MSDSPEAQYDARLKRFNAAVALCKPGGVPDESKPENVEAMTEAVFKYGVY